jgi:hypothetical protein
LTFEDETFMSSELLGSDDSGLFYDIPEEGDTQHIELFAQQCVLLHSLTEELGGGTSSVCSKVLYQMHAQIAYHMWIMWIYMEK